MCEDVYVLCKKHFVISTEGRDLPGFRRSLTFVRDDGIKHFYASFAPLQEKILQTRPVEAM